VKQTRAATQGLRILIKTVTAGEARRILGRAARFFISLAFTLVFLFAAICLCFRIAERIELNVRSERLERLNAPERCAVVAKHQGIWASGNAAYPVFFSAILYSVPINAHEKEDIEKYFEAKKFKDSECVWNGEASPRVYFYDDGEFDVYDEIEILPPREQKTKVFEEIVKDNINYDYYVVYMACFDQYRFFTGF